MLPAQLVRAHAVWLPGFLKRSLQALICPPTFLQLQSCGAGIGGPSALWDALLIEGASGVALYSWHKSFCSCGTACVH